MPRRSRGPNWPPWQAKEKDENYTGLPYSFQSSKAYSKLTGNQFRLLFFFWRRVDTIRFYSKSKGKYKGRLPRDDFPGYGPYMPGPMSSFRTT